MPGSVARSRRRQGGAQPRQRDTDVAARGIGIELWPDQLGNAVTAHRADEDEQLDERAHPPPAHVCGRFAGPSGICALDRQRAEHADPHRRLFVVSDDLE